MPVKHSSLAAVLARRNPNIYPRWEQSKVIGIQTSTVEQALRWLLPLRLLTWQHPHYWHAVPTRRVVASRLPARATPALDGAITTCCNRIQWVGFSNRSAWHIFGILPAVITDDMGGLTFCNASRALFPSRHLFILKSSTDELTALSVIYGSYRISEVHFMRQIRIWEPGCELGHHCQALNAVRVTVVQFRHVHPGDDVVLTVRWESLQWHAFDHIKLLHCPVRPSQL